MTYLLFVGIVLSVTHLKGLNMGNKRKQARRAARQALKSKPRIHGYEIDTIIVDELAVAPALPPKPKRDNSPIEARNEAQAHYLISLDTKSLTFATGEAGCGKTYLAAAVAAQRLLDKEVGKIIVTRPVLQAEEDLGFLPGDMSEKFAPFFRPVYDVLQKRLGGSFLEYCLKPEVAKNGFTVTGESACASPENFDPEIGRKITRQNAIAKIWPLEGYLLKQQLHEAK
ncbi:TPA: phosphate starvation-inducible protein PhoH [Escherichia coli]|jgi:phosphate starvation-inducible PhoH-like protein|nr:phosphate starvation-inducible protein PhoH [Escherichia coli]HAW4068436.1 phosphate starvation-inducible protein PhoH [Escherichia coli]